MRWIDTHTHLYLEDFNNDRFEMMHRAKHSGVDKMLLPNIDLSSLDSMFQMQMNFPDQVELMMGLHPCSVTENFKEDLKSIFEQFKEIKFVGIGEIGLDLYWDKSTISIQQEAFIIQLNWSKDLELPVSIHSREATKEAIDCIQRVGGEVKGVFHCFSGDMEQARTIINRGMYLGIGGSITYKKTNLPEIIKYIGLEHLVLETDSPYLSPHPYRGKRNESSYIPLIGSHLADILSIRIEEVAQITSRNARLAFNLKD